MFGFDPSRLLKQAWNDPSALARELYDMFTGSEPRVVEAPVTFQPTDGRTALTVAPARHAAAPPELAQLQLIRDQNRASSAVAQATKAQQAAPRRPAPPPPPAPSGVQPAAGGIVSAVGAAVDFFTEAPRLIAEKAAGDAIADAVASNFSRAASSPLPPPQAPGPNPIVESLARSPQPPPRTEPPPRTITPARPISAGRSQLQAGPARVSRSYPSLLPSNVRAYPVPVSGPVAPYSNPIFDVTGQASFKGADPVQFDVEPLVWNPQSVAFEPFSAKFTRTGWTSDSVRLALVTEDIFPATYSNDPSQPPQPGKGKAKTYVFDPDSGALREADQGDGREVWNLSPLPVLGNTWVLVEKWMMAWWVHPSQASTALALANADIDPRSGLAGSGPVTILGEDLSASQFSGITAYNLATTKVASGHYLGLLVVGRRAWVHWEDCG